MLQFCCIQHGGKAFSVTAETDSFMNFAPTEGGGSGDGSHRKRGKWGLASQKKGEVGTPHRRRGSENAPTDGGGSRDAPTEGGGSGDAPQKEEEVRMPPQKEKEVGMPHRRRGSRAVSQKEGKWGCLTEGWGCWEEP